MWLQTFLDHQFFEMVCLNQAMVKICSRLPNVMSKHTHVLDYRHRGEPRQEIHALPWRFGSDLHLVALNKELVPICQLLRKMAVENGLSEIDIPDHQLTPRMVEAPGTNADYLALN